MQVAGEHWVTINGVHVLIGGNGRVKKGPKSMIGMTKEGVAKKTTNPNSKPRKKTHAGRKNANQLKLEKAGYSENTARKNSYSAEKTNKLLLGDSQKRIAKWTKEFMSGGYTRKEASAIAKELVKTGLSDYDLTRDNYYNVETLGKRGAKKYTPVKDYKKPTKKKSSSSKSTTKKSSSTKLEGATTGKFHEVTTPKTRGVFYNSKNYKDALTNAGLTGAFTSINDPSVKKSTSNKSDYLRSTGLGKGATQRKPTATKRGKKK